MSLGATRSAGALTYASSPFFAWTSARVAFAASASLLLGGSSAVSEWVFKPLGKSTVTGNETGTYHEIVERQDENGETARKKRHLSDIPCLENRVRSWQAPITPLVVRARLEALHHALGQGATRVEPVLRASESVGQNERG